MEMNEFKEKLTALLNQFGVDNECNMPDYMIAESVINHIKDMANTTKANMEFHGWKGVGENDDHWIVATKKHPEASIVLARVMPKNEARVVKVVDGKFIVDGGEMVTHWMDIPTF